MKIGLYDVDSKIPNLALMKLSSYHRARGDTTELYLPLLAASYGRIYASKVFDFSSPAYIRPDMICGGTGINVTTTLTEEQESLTPDYSIYNYPHSIGFTMRGCRLNCAFCVVPKKEGRPRSTQTVEEIWTNRGSDFIILLDNDFFGNPDWQARIEEIKALNLRVNFSQGLNIRIITEEQAQTLASIRFVSPNGKYRRVHFAWDKPRDEAHIKSGLNTILDAGIKPHEISMYVLIGFDSTQDEDLHRIESLRGWGIDPFVMPYRRNDSYQRKFARWVNHKAIFKTCSWGDYRTAKLEVAV